MTTDDGKPDTFDGDSASSDDAGGGLSIESVQDALSVGTVDVLAGDPNSDYAYLRVQYWWTLRGQRFTAKTTKYKARSNGRNEGNVRFRINAGSPTDWYELTTQAHQDGEWHDLVHEFTVSGNAISASIDFNYIYDKSGGDPTLWGNTIVPYTVSPPSIYSPSNNQSVLPIFQILGTGEILATVQIAQSNVGNEIAPPAQVDEEGVWRATVDPAIALGGFSFTARQLVDGKYSEWASDVRVTVALPAPVILVPANASIVNEPRPAFSGTGENGAQVQIRRNGNQISNNVNVVNRHWSAALNADLDWGRNTLTARQRMGNVFSGDRSVEVTVRPTRLAITSPEPNSHENTQFSVRGSGGISGATVDIYLESNNSLVGTGRLNAEDDWSIAVTVLPGPVSLVATQTINGAVSERSAPRGFRIRPPKLTDPTVTYPNQAQARFSGSGDYEDAMVDVVIDTGPVGAEAPPAVPVVSGRWETTSRNFPPGSYTLKLIQRIPNNAGGWIESEPLEHRVVRQPSAPGEVTDAADGE